MPNVIKSLFRTCSSFGKGFRRSYWRIGKRRNWSWKGVRRAKQENHQ